MLNKKKEDRYITIIRSGKPVKVSVHNMLVGDIMILEQGDMIPIDGVLIQGYNVSCDEALSTGESDVVKKMPAEAVSQALLREPVTCDRMVIKIDPFLLSGARVVDGIGTYLVTAVSPYSSHGRTIIALRNDPGMTPLQARLNVLAGRHILAYPHSLGGNYANQMPRIYRKARLYGRIAAIFGTPYRVFGPASGQPGQRRGKGPKLSFDSHHGYHYHRGCRSRRFTVGRNTLPSIRHEQND